MFSKKIISTIIMVLVSGLIAMGQTSKDDKKTPEPEVGTLEAAWKPVIMHHYIGIRGGYGTGTARLEPIKIMTSYSGMKNFGINYRFDAPEQLYVGCIEIDINYMEKGFIYELYKDSDVFYSRKYSMIELPILWQPYVPISKKNQSNRIFLNAGPYIGYSLKSEYRQYKEVNGEQTTIEEGDYHLNPARDNRFEYGLVFGAGLQFAVKRITFGLDFRYNIMMSDVMKTPKNYPDNKFYRSPVDQMNLSFSVGYKLHRKKNEEKITEQLSE